MAKGKDYIQDERIISAFLNNFRMVDVMKETGLSSKTVYKIRNDPMFQKVLQERKDAVLQEAVNKMRGYMTRNVDILQRIIEDPETPAQTKINGIQLMFYTFRDWINTTDLIKRVEALQETSGNVFTTFKGGAYENIGQIHRTPN